LARKDYGKPGKPEIFNHKEHKDHIEKLIFRPSLSAKALATADVFALSVLSVVKSLSDLLVDRAGGGAAFSRHGAKIT
jgi:hypothetical protein